MALMNLEPLSAEHKLAVKVADLEARGFGRNRVKALVNQSHWDIVGKLFNFKPVFHEGTKNFIDWRCVPTTLSDYLKKKTPKPVSPRIKTPTNENKLRRTQHRKYIKSLMLAGNWYELRSVYGFRVLFVEKPTGEHVIDWDSISMDMYHIMLCGGALKRTPYTKEGGIYDPLKKPKSGYTYQNVNAHHGRPHRKAMLPKEQRMAHFKADERGPIRIQLYHSQRGVCHWCKQVIPIGRDWTIEHIIPRSRGGTNAAENVVGCCWKCNIEKDCMTPEEFMASDYYLKEIKPNLPTLK